MGEVVWFSKLLVLVFICHGFDAIVEGGQESAPGVNDTKNDQNRTQAMLQEMMNYLLEGAKESGVNDTKNDQNRTQAMLRQMMNYLLEGAQESGVNDMKNGKNHIQAIPQEMMDSFDLLLSLTVQNEKPGDFSWNFQNEKDKWQTHVDARIDTLKNNLDHKLNTLREGLENTLGNKSLQLNDMISQKLKNYSTDSKTDIMNGVQSLLKNYSTDSKTDMQSLLNNYSTDSKTDIMNGVQNLLNSLHLRFVQDLSDFEKRMDEKLAQSQNESQKTTTCNADTTYGGHLRYRGLEILKDNTLNEDILCDTRPECDGWIVIQRRMEGDVDFFRSWNDYKKGFGTPPGDFWLGNDKIHELTNKSVYELRIDYDNGTRELFAVYSSFKIDSEADKYTLRLGSHSGTLEENNPDNGLTYSNGSPFSTFDRDNDQKADGSCARIRHGGWWFKDCYRAFLNGNWGLRDASAMPWVTGSFVHYTNSTQMKIRRKNM